ncbi:MAG: DnaJ domain-containing protein [Candidatus Latescibacterota bacterium]
MKDLYAILGVDPHASQGEVRAAYLARTRVIHPDRFDPQRHPEDWAKANEMLAELNDAYSVLRNPHSRGQYDRARATPASAGQDRAAAHAPHPDPGPQPQAHAPAFELGELTPGSAGFASLPTPVKTRLLRRQANIGEEQYQIRLSSLTWNYVFVAGFLCWSWYLLAGINGPRWQSSTILWYALATTAVGLLIGRNIATVALWHMSALKPYFYVTPLYFIKTEYDIVSFRPIWSLKDVSLTHNYRNGLYQDTDLVLEFEGHSEALSIRPKAKVDCLLDWMRRFDARVRAAYAEGDDQYFHSNDDFYRVPRTAAPASGPLPIQTRLLVYAASTVLCLVGLAVAVLVNSRSQETRWVRHDAPERQVETQRSRSRPDPGPTSHPQQPLPANGPVRVFTARERQAPFEIRAAQGSHYLVKLVDARSNAPAMTVFVRSGATADVEVPLGTCEVRYAAGQMWYGDQYLFGPDTGYSKADRLFTFEVMGDQVTGFTITLYRVPTGNLPTSMIEPADF